MPSTPAPDTADASAATASSTKQSGMTDATEEQSDDPLPAVPPDVQPDREHPAHEAEPPVEND